MCSKGDNHINLLCEYLDYYMYCTHYIINKLLFRERAETGWFRIMIMCPSGAKRLSEDY